MGESVSHEGRGGAPEVPRVIGRRRVAKGMSVSAMGRTKVEGKSHPGG